MIAHFNHNVSDPHLKAIHILGMTYTYVICIFNQNHAIQRRHARFSLCLTTHHSQVSLGTSGHTAIAKENSIEICGILFWYPIQILKIMINEAYIRFICMWNSSMFIVVRIFVVICTSRHSVSVRIWVGNYIHANHGVQLLIHALYVS